MKNIKIKKVLYCLLITLLTLPVIRMFLPLKELYPLEGAVNKSSSTILSVDQWLSGKFQNEFESYFNDNIGWRSIFVRLHNQIKYSLYHEITAKSVVEGKNEYLFEENYIKAYNGSNYIGDDEITLRVNDVKTLQDSLSKHGISLLICIAPGKGTFYPEYISDEMLVDMNDKNNYKEYVRQFSDNRINVLDFNKWFRDMKDTASYTLYPKWGIHWSYYGMLLSADSIAKRVESMENISMPEMKVNRIDYTSKCRFSDYDIGDGMNLLFKKEHELMCYPKIEWQSDSTTIKPKALVVSDSFYWSMYNTGFGSNVLSSGAFWYYNNQVYPESFNLSTTVKDIDISKRLFDNDVIILMSTDANLHKFSWGFVETALEVFNGTYVSPDNYDLKVKHTIMRIRSDEKWLKDIERKARERNVTLDSMLVLDARWIVDQE